MKYVDFASNWQEIARSFLKLGVTAYGGPAVLGLMQAEFQEKRQWVPKERFLEGLSLVNMLPGATPVQLGIFLGYARGGWWGGVLAGLCYVLPGFCIMFALTLTYAFLGTTPIMRGGLYGLGPVVLGIFTVAVYRLGRSAVTTLPQLMIALTAAAATACSPLGIAAILALAAGVGIWLFHSPRVGAAILIALAASLAVIHVALWSPGVLVAPLTPAITSAHPAGLTDIGTFFFKVGAFIFGGGLTMVPFVQAQVVNQFHWLTPQEFIDGLALGRFTPGPMLMIAAYVGYKVAGLGGAVIAAMATFLPSFLLMLSILPMFERVRTLVWTKAAMLGVGPAVMGVLVIALVRMAPHALPAPLAIAILMGTLIALLAWRIGALKLMSAGAVVGVLRSCLLLLPGVRAILWPGCSNAGKGGIMLPSDMYSQANAVDPVLDERTVLDIVRRHVVRCSAVTSIDETGGEARVYVLDNNLVLKVQRPHRLRPRTSLEKEAFFLHQLAAYPEIVVPQVLGYGRYDNVEYIVMTQMPGVPALTVELTGVQRMDVLHQLGRTLRRLHAIPQTPFYGSALFPGNRTQDAFVERVRANLAHAVQVIDATPNLWWLDVSPADLVSRVLARLPASVELVALHSNPGPVHTFVQPDTLDFVGLIDFGDAYISHPALDWRWPTHTDRVALLHGYCDETPVTDEFMAAWRAALVLSDMSALATRPETRPQALERLRDLLTTFT